MPTINTIVEGCYPDTPSRLMYCDVDVEIPRNARVLFSHHDLHPQRYLLYLKSESFRDTRLVRHKVFDKKSDPDKIIQGGWPLNENINNFRWIFDSQRSLVTKDGRLYVQASFFREDWLWYLEKASEIFRDCEAIFKGKKN